jgi:integrase
LRQRDGVAALALEFLILTVCRSGEVRGASWSEVDLESRVWVVPALRMKGARPHRVPLTDRALQILMQVRPLRRADDLVFPGLKPGSALSDMTLAAVLRRMGIPPSKASPHGFRSTFKDWATETTSFPNELSEAALAHISGDATERAYRRGDQFVRRRELMEAWARYCEPSPDRNVVVLGAIR